jgi:HemY protein
MRSLFWLLAVFAAAVALVILGRVDAGYVLFVYPPYRVEVTMIFFAIAALVAFVLLYGFVRLMRQVLSLPANVRAYRTRRRLERAHAALARALQAYYEGRYRRAEREAALAYETGPAPGIAALLAARAAHQLRDFASRDRWFERADGAGDAWRTARLVSRAELALEERDFGAARDALRGVETAAPRHLTPARMLLRAARGLGAWDEVLRLAGQLVKRDAIAPALAEEYEVQANVELLGRSSDDALEFERRWRGLRERDQLHPRIAGAAARHASALGLAPLAREILENALAADWNSRLVTLYAELPAELTASERAEEARARIEQAERWLIAHNRDPELLASLGRLCAQAELWGKARSFFEASLSFEETRGVELELARLAERLGDAAEAQRHFRRAAELP